MIRFTVPAVPVAQPRQRVGVIHGHARTYLPDSHPVHVFKAAVADSSSKAFPNGPLTGPLLLSANFIMPRPKSMTTKRGPNARVYSSKKPDLDNLMKSLADAMNGIAYVDDSQIATARIHKTIAAANESPRVEVEILSLVVQKPEIVQ